MQLADQLGVCLGPSQCCLAALSLSRCGLGSELTRVVKKISEIPPSLTSLNVSHNSADGLISALCDALKGNRSLTALKVTSNLLR